MEVSASEFWWRSITGPQMLLMNVVDSLLDNHNVVLRIPADLPWRHEMRAETLQMFQDRSDNDEAVIFSVDIIDDDPEDLEPGKYILQKFASSEVRRGYREKSKHSIQEYIKAQKVLNNRIIWIKGLTGAKAQKWLTFCMNFSNTSIDSGLFVLEIHGENVSIPEVGDMNVVDFNKNVRRYDVQLFDSFILDSRSDLTDTWKNYIATTASMLCGTDAEISEALISGNTLKTISSIDRLSEIAKMKCFSKRGMEDGSEHILSLVRNNNQDELNHRVWKAQVQVLFPIIEIERIDIINAHRDSIQQAIDENAILQYGENLIQADDVELGTLCFMMSCKDNMGLRMLYIPDENTRNRIRFLHQCRNKLAHANCCELDEVNALIN